MYKSLFTFLSENMKFRFVRLQIHGLIKLSYTYLHIFQSLFILINIICKLLHLGKQLISQILHMLKLTKLIHSFIDLLHSFFRSFDFICLFNFLNDLIKRTLMCSKLLVKRMIMSCLLIKVRLLLFLERVELIFELQ